MPVRSRPARAPARALVPPPSHSPAEIRFRSRVPSGERLWAPESHVRAWLTSGESPVPVRSRPARAPARALALSDWEEQVQAGPGQMVKITDTVCGRSHLVHKNRLRKAKLKLGRREIALDLAKGGGYGCSCQRRCGEGIPIGFAEDLRARLFAEPTEQAASNVIVGWLCGSLPRGNRARYIITDGLARYHCCAATYSGIVGVRDVLFLSCALNHHLFLQVSLKKLYKCARAATASQGRGATFIHGNSGRIGRVGA